MSKTERLRRCALYAALALALGLLLLDRFAAHFYRPTADATAVVLYTTDWCPYCAHLRTHLRRHGIPFEEYDVEKSLAGGMGFWTLRGRGVPVAVVGPVVVHGFDVNGLAQALTKIGYSVGEQTTAPVGASPL